MFSPLLIPAILTGPWPETPVAGRPWGPGRWGPLPGTDNALFADFVGSKHNIRFDLADPSQFTSARCGDGEPVLGRLASGKL